MASAAPHVKLLRQLATAKDDYVSGALDIAWDGGNATIFVVFGQPSHAQLCAGGYTVSGQDAVDSLPRMLPRSFQVSGWRRSMAPEETLACSIEELAAPFVELAGVDDAPDGADDTAADSWFGELDDSPDLGFGVDDFPLLPDGAPTHGPAAPADLRLQELLPTLTASLVTLSGPRLRAAGVVVSGEVIDAVWVDSDDHARGDTAVIALLGAREGSMTVCALPDTATAEALPMLWRLPHASSVDAAWVDPASFSAALQSDRQDRAVLVEAPVRGAAIFRRGELLCVFAEPGRTPLRDPGLVHTLLSQGEGRVQLLQPRGTPATVRPAPPLPDATPPAPPPDPPVTAAAGRPASPPSSIGVDFTEVKHELSQIAIAWLGDRDGETIVQLIAATPPTIDDIVALIDTVRAMHIPGLDPATLHGLARELHQHAAERLCGA
jgi:hypothetical protein